MNGARGSNLAAMPPLAIVALVADKYATPVEQIRSKSKLPHVRKARVECYDAFRNHKGWSWGQIADYFGVARSAPRNALERRNSVQAESARFSENVHPEELQAQIHRLAGIELGFILKEHFPEQKFCFSLHLAIFAEQYPKILAPAVILELYEVALRRIHGHTDHPELDVEGSRIRAIKSTLRKTFRVHGLPDPIRVAGPGLGLSHEAAAWMHYNFGRPVWYDDRVIRKAG